jgi:CheY-like chemotaxis protein
MKKILLIEDNPDIRENATELLELAGYMVTAAPNGKMGLEMALANPPDIILSDVMMPLMNGHEVFLALQANSITRHIPFVFLTSSVERKDVESALQKGASGYIKKPFEESELLQTVERCLHRGDTSR